MMGGNLFLELEFPEAIIQRIQSLLTVKEAVQTTTLSKSWHNAWITRPNLEFDDHCIRFETNECYAIGEFSEYARTTMKRYEQSNLKIESFKLCMHINWYGGAYLADKLIVKALKKLGATRLNLHLDNSFVFPCEVVFGSDNLVELSVKGCRIELDGISLIRCGLLESLSLDAVNITINGLSNIISSCPFIEKLSLSNIYNDYEYKEQLGSMPVGLMNTNLYRLKCLVLCYRSFTTLFPGDSLSKFPFLTDFTLNLEIYTFMEEEKVIQISNCTLEHIKIELEKDTSHGRYWSNNINVGVKVELDVPSIRKFTFECEDIIPSLSFVSSSTREWESHVSITHYGGLTTSWFGVLNELLAELRQSKIHLSLQVECGEGFEYRVGDLSFIRKHELESLLINMTGLPSLSCYALVDGLFRLCRPKLITQTHTQKVEEEEVLEMKTNFDLLWHALDQGIHSKVSVPRQFMYGLNDLKEANAQIFGDDVMGWRPPIPLKSLLEDQDQHSRVRLLLKWDL